jgi:CRP/FNR family cyclic AMP-dependent transcriptional regulator
MAKGKASDGAPKTFSGRRGKRRLLEAIKSQTLISGNVELANETINSGVVEEYHSGELLMEQGSPENDIFLVVSGAVSVRINRREVAMRHAGMHVGEMALVDPLAKRSATVVAIEPTVALRNRNTDSR